MRIGGAFAESEASGCYASPGYYCSRQIIINHIQKNGVGTYPTPFFIFIPPAFVYMKPLEDIRILTEEELIICFEKLGEPNFRARQVHEWLWKKSARCEI